jgi:hypothetical protein
MRCPIHAQWRFHPGHVRLLMLPLLRRVRLPLGPTSIFHVGEGTPWSPSPTSRMLEIYRARTGSRLPRSGLVTGRCRGSSCSRSGNRLPDKAACGNWSRRMSRLGGCGRRWPRLARRDGSSVPLRRLT